MGAFTLSDGEDETRLLREQTTGYSVALPGRPVLASVPDGSPRYDAIVRLQDINVEHGFRLDTIPSSVDPEALAKALATAYGSNRAGKAPHVISVADRYCPPSVVGSRSTYPLASTEQPMVEHLWVLVRPTASGASALYWTTRFRPADLDQIEWEHLRGSNLDQHRWDSAPRDVVPTLWPESWFVRPSAKLAMSDGASEEALAKADGIGSLTDAQSISLSKGLREIAQIDQPPRHVLLPGLLEECMRRMAMIGPTRAVEAMLRNIERCETMHDLRGWVWQCIWAMGNRTDRSRGFGRGDT